MQLGGCGCQQAAHYHGVHPAGERDREAARRRDSIPARREESGHRLHQRLSRVPRRCRVRRLPLATSPHGAASVYYGACGAAAAWA